jgi:gas vesicle protein
MKRSDAEHHKGVNRMDEYSDDRTRGNIVLSLMAGVLVGGVIGAGTMLLLAPQSGKKTREQIRVKSIQIRDQTTGAIEGAVEQARTKVRQVSDNVQGKAQRLENRGRAIIEGTKEVIENSREIQ